MPKYKKILTILCICLYPTILLATNCPDDDPSNPTACVSYVGCYFQLGDVMTPDECKECPYGTYNDGDPNGCKPCPTGSTVNQFGSTSVYDCVCTNQNQHILNQNGSYVCNACPSASYYDTTTHACECVTGAGLNNCACPTNSTLNSSGTACECDSSHPNGSLDTSTNILTCSNCPSHSQYNSSTRNCDCDAGYYKVTTNGNDVCERCPVGMISAAGSDAKDDCYMDSSTQFCDGSGTICFTWIPSGTVNAR